MVDNFIKESAEVDYINTMPIEKFTLDELIELTEKARKNNLMLTLWPEHSNCHQGVLVQLIRRDVASEFLRWL